MKINYFIILYYIFSSGFCSSVSQSAKDFNVGLDAVTGSANKLLNTIGGFLVQGKNTYDNTESQLNINNNLQKEQTINNIQKECTEEIKKINAKINNIANQVRTWLNQDLITQKQIINETNKSIDKLNQELNNTSNTTAQNYILRELTETQSELSKQLERNNILKQRLEQLEHSLQLNTESQIQRYLSLFDKGMQAAGMAPTKTVNYAYEKQQYSNKDDKLTYPINNNNLVKKIINNSNDYTFKKLK